MSSSSKKKSPEAPRDGHHVGWSPAARTIATLLLVWHLAAVFVASWSMPPSSELSQSAAMPFRPYLGATYLNRSVYRFFAPNPPMYSNRVRYEVALEDGQTVSGTFPDRDVHRPRLVYHRHFMIAEQVVAQAVLPEEDIRSANLPPAYFSQAPPGEFERYRQARREYVAALKRHVPAMQSLGEHLLHVHSGSHVKLWLVQRRVPTRQEVIDEMKLTDKRFIRERWLGEMTAGGTWQWSEQIRGQRN